MGSAQGRPTPSMRVHPGWFVVAGLLVYGLVDHVEVRDEDGGYSGQGREPGEVHRAATSLFTGS